MRVRWFAEQITRHGLVLNTLLTIDPALPRTVLYCASEMLCPENPDVWSISALPPNVGGAVSGQIIRSDSAPSAGLCNES